MEPFVVLAENFLAKRWKPFMWPFVVKRSVTSGCIAGDVLDSMLPLEVAAMNSVVG
jgi:hypothetical protein